MLFKKNKIAKGIKDSTSSGVTTSSDFETLDSVKQKKKSRSWINRFFVQQYKDGVENVKGKWAATNSYFKNNWLQVVQSFMLILLTITFIMGLCILFEPFNGVAMITSSGYSNGNIPVAINNMFTLLLKPNGITYGLTGFGIAYTVLLILFLILAIVWFVKKHKEKSLICTKCKATKIHSYVAYASIAIAFLLVVIITYIPPTTASIASNGQEILANRQIADEIYRTIIIHGGTPSAEKQAEFITAIKNLYDIIGKGTLSASPTYDDCLTWFKSNSEWLWPSYSISSSYAFYQDLNNNLPSTINAAGYSILSLTSIFFILGLIVLPIVNEFIKVKEDIKINTKINVDIDFEAMKENMNVFKRAIVSFVAKTQTSFFRKVSQIKNKDSFRKYKKEINEKGMSASQQKDSFKSDVTENTVTFVITKEEIEKHEPNKAFLNSQGQYMYHDGNHKYFIVKNDAWVPYDINQGVHQAQVNIASTRDTDVSKKQAKESKWFKNNRLAKKISEKTSKDKATIDLPDEDLNKIISELDI